MEQEKLIALVTAGQAGDPDALNGLFEAFYNDIYYFALKTVKDPDRACDVTQDTFVRIMEHIGQLQAPAAFVTWMKQIAYRECLRYTPRAQEILVDTDEDGASIFDLAAEDRTEFIPDAALDQQEFRKTILDMLDTLSAEQRAATMLYYYDELSVRQIAQIQNVSEGTVKSRLNYARKSIKSAVEHYEKKHGVRLHSVALLPLLAWLFATSRTSMPAAGVLAASGAVTSVAAAAGGVAAGSTAAGGAVATATAAGSAAAGTAAAGGAAAGTAAGISLTAKVIAAVTAAAVLTTTGVTVAVRSKREPALPSTEPSSAYVETLDNPTEQPATQQTPEVTTEPTAAPTEPSAEPTTEAPTEPTEAPTEETTEAPTEETTEPPTEETTEESTEPAAQGEEIPAGCRYITADGVTLEAGEHMPETPTSGDQFVTPDYTYMYQHYISYDTWQSDSGACWGVAVNDKSQSSYGALRAYICNRPVVWLSYTFYGCSNMTAAPAIPDTVTGLYFTFAGCSSLVSAPVIHGNIGTMSNAFSDCVSLTTAPTIPANVSFLTFTFSGCTSLTGEVVIHAEPGNFQYCFSGTVNPIVLTGSSTMLEELAATATDGNVTVA